MNRFVIIKLSFIILFIGFCIWLNVFYLPNSPAEIRTWILSFGLIAPVVYVLIFVLRSLVMFPVAVMLFTSGLAFGFGLGSLLSWFGTIGSAAFSFYLARKFGKGLHISKNRRTLEQLEEHLVHRGFIYVFFVRMLPFIPFDLISYAAGISRIRFRDFITASTFGIIPEVLIYNYIGSRLIEGNLLAVAVALIILVILTGLLLIYRKKMGWYA
jgi:uncharacterized membrane protein YdjX (TVP38/TMEM64 family)